MIKVQKVGCGCLVAQFTIRLCVHENIAKGYRGNVLHQRGYHCAKFPNQTSLRSMYIDAGELIANPKHS